MKNYTKQIIFTILVFLAVLTINSYAIDKTAKKVVFVNMVADLFHAGHVAFLKQAKQHGDVLIVGLHSDELASKYKRKPICNIDERKTVVEACKYVNKVICNTPLNIDREFINKHKIDLVIHGDDFDAEKINHFYGDIIDLNKFVTVPYTQGISTSEIIKRIEKHLSDQVEDDLLSVIHELENISF
jgi:glycerol-3-phosphate cytidylyltransferase